MPKKTNSLADALRGSAQPEPSPKRPQGKRGQRDGSTRLARPSHQFLILGRLINSEWI